MAAWRTLLLPLAFGWVFSAVAVVMLAALVAPQFILRTQQRWVRSLGVVSCWLLGIKIRIENPERLAQLQGQILAFNHINMLDLIVLASLWRRGWSAIYKQEFNNIPLIGRTMQFLGLLPIDRRNRAAAVATLANAAEVIRAEHKTLLVAPEGTRSNSEQLGPFKTGPFHLASELKVPMVPMLMQGNARAMRGLLVYGGTVTIKLLAPIDTSHWHSDNVAAQLHSTRQLFLDGLGQQ